MSGEVKSAPAAWRGPRDVISRPFSPTLKPDHRGLSERIRDLLKPMFSAFTSAYGVVGVDVSYWQGKMNWEMAKNKGAKFAFIRAGYGLNYVDTQCDKNRTDCFNLNIPFGLYWYFLPNLSPTTQAKNFAKVWAANPGSLYPVIDLEESGGLTKTGLETWLKKAIDEFTRASFGVKPMIYSSRYFLNTYLPASSWMLSYPYWHAQYTTDSQPTLPNGWKNWRFWQYTNKGDGKAYGAQSTYIDLNRYCGNWQDFLTEFKIGVPQTPPEQPPQQVYLPNVMSMQVKGDVSALNVRIGPGTQYEDVGNMYPGDKFEADLFSGRDCWARIGDGQKYAGYWVCVKLGSSVYCEPSQD